jgi:hypothetical protein
MSKEKILREFLNSDLKIISKEKLIKYVEFCIENDQQEKIKFKTSHHHILPQAKGLPFKNFSNLKENFWNGTHLLHKDHYYAHWLLCESVDHYSIISSFYAMNYKDLRNKRLKECELISPEEFQVIKEKKLRMHSEWGKLELNDGVRRVDRIVEKGTKKRTKEIILNNKKTTIAKEAGKKCSETKLKKSKIYNLYHIEKGLISENVYAKDIRKIHQNLELRTKDRYMGCTSTSRTQLIKSGKAHLIGLYSELILSNF